MRNEIGIKWDRKVCGTHVSARFSAPGFRDPNSGDWEKYAADCHESLHRVAARESVEILVWSIDLDWEDELILITHHVFARGLLPGATPLRIARALSPARGYATLDALTQALKNDLPVCPLLKRAAEFNCGRYDRDRKRLRDPIPAHLLALALLEPGWRGLISPRDNPWAYINTTTRRIYQRSYSEGNSSSNPREDAGLSPEQVYARVESATDELVIENLADVVRNSGCSADVCTVLAARADGKKWDELPRHLTGLTGTKWDQRRVEAARASAGRRIDKLRASAWASSHWEIRSNKASCYRERLGVPWNGLWTYSHYLQGSNLEIAREVMSAERKELFREP